MGGSDAGNSAALRSSKVDPTVEVTVVVADSFPGHGIYGLPFYLKGSIIAWEGKLIQE